MPSKKGIIWSRSPGSAMVGKSDFWKHSKSFSKVTIGNCPSRKSNWGTFPVKDSQAEVRVLGYVKFQLEGTDRAGGEPFLEFYCENPVDFLNGKFTECEDSP